MNIDEIHRVMLGRRVVVTTSHLIQRKSKSNPLSVTYFGHNQYGDLCLVSKPSFYVAY